VKKYLYFPIKISIFLTGKFRGSGRTRMMKTIIGKTLRGIGVLVTSGVTSAVLKPGTMGIKIILS